MSLSQTKFAGTGADDSSTGTIAWASTGNILASDDARATANLTAGSISHYLLASNFGFTIPQGSSIEGVLVEWEQSQDNSGGGDIKDNASRLYYTGVIESLDKSNATSWPTTDAFQSYGSSSDLWGHSVLKVSSINDTTFGAALSVKENGGASPSIARVDSCRITVYYTPLNPKPVEDAIVTTIQRSWENYPRPQVWAGTDYEQSYLRRRVVQAAIAPPPITMNLTTIVMVSINPVPTMDLKTTVTVTVSTYSSEVFFQLTTNVIVLTGVSLNLGGTMASSRYRR